MKKLAIKIFLAPALLMSAMTLSAAPTPAQPDDRTIMAEHQPTADVDGDMIEFRNTGAEPVKFEIFSITGQLVKSVVVKNAPVKIQLPKGFYIIKCDNWTKRVMLK